MEVNGSLSFVFDELWISPYGLSPENLTHVSRPSEFIGAYYMNMAHRIGPRDSQDDYLVLGGSH